MMIENQLTKNFTLTEFRCHDGTDVPWTLLENAQKLADNLQVIRDEIGKPVHCVSVFRNRSYNTRIKGSRRSYHMKCMAADIKVKGMKASEVRAVVLQLIEDGRILQGGVGSYARFTHYDIRERKARW
jgi:uncharacterized protein YcbK (DUF882 family)